MVSLHGSKRMVSFCSAPMRLHTCKPQCIYGYASSRQATEHGAIVGDETLGLLALVAGSLSLGVAAMMVASLAKQRPGTLPRRQTLLRPSSPHALHVSPLQGSCFGAEISGVDLLNPIPRCTVHKLRQALREHGLLICRRQDLQPSDFLELVAIFGQPIPAAGQQSPVALYRVQDRDPCPRGADFWHSDNSYNTIPGGPTALYALDVPLDEEGVAFGDTIFADATAAAEDLPTNLCKQVSFLSAAHNMAHNGGVALPESGSADWKEQADALHPILRTNPLTLRMTLFVSPAYVRHVVGLPPQDSKHLLSALYEHILQPQRIYTHKWRKGDVLIWDNGRLLHRATTLDMPKGAARSMWRVQTRGPGIIAEPEP